MEKLINQILQELYELDENFRSQEKEIRKILAKLIAAKPAADIDDTFRNSLKQKVLLEFSNKINKSKSKFIINFNYMNKFSIALGAVVIVLMAAAGAVYYQQLGGKQITQESFFDTRMVVNDVGRDAFGSLAVSQGGEAAPQATGLGAGDMSKVAVSETTPRLQSGGGGGMAEAGSMVVMPYYTYEYKYVGDELTAPETDTVPVYKRVVSGIINNSLSQVLANINLGLVDLKTFSGKSIQNFSIAEEGKFGYIINVDAEYGRISFYQNYKTWDNPYEKCRDEACYENTRLKMSDVPSDEQIINIASQFLSGHNIDTSIYGEPQISNYWQFNTDSNGQVYVPDDIQVVYPHLIEGKLAYDESGNPYGLSVTVNIRYKKVSGIWNLLALNFDKSEYEVEKDMGRIVKFAEQGNWRYPLYDDPNAQKITVELGTPDLILAVVYTYDNEPQELYVPALSFPVVNMSNTDIAGVDNRYMMNMRIVVPLVKKLLDASGDGYPKPMPLLEPVPATGTNEIEPDVMEPAPDMQVSQ